jgi:hypothetical protein
MSAPATPARRDPPVDPGGARFSAALTTLVLALVLISDSGWLLAAQALVFGLRSIAGLRFSPYPVLFRPFVAPRLAPPTQREEAAPVRFSQTVGLVFAVVGTVGYLAGFTGLGIVATALALAAAFLNVASGFCPGCELYTVIARFRTNNQQGATA